MRRKQQTSICLILALLLLLPLSLWARGAEAEEPAGPGIEEAEPSAGLEIGEIFVPEESDTEEPVEPEISEEPDTKAPSEPEEPEKPDTEEPSESEEPEKPDTEEPSELEGPGEPDTEAPSEPEEPEKPGTEEPSEPEEISEEPGAMELEIPMVVLADEPVISISVPNMGNIVVNPYGLKVTTAAGTSTEQIVSAPLVLVNHSDMAINVAASAVGQTSGSAQLVSTPPSSDATKKQLFLYAEFQPSTDAAGAGVTWSGQYSSAGNQLLVGTRALEKKNVLTLGAGAAAPTYGAFRLFGAASRSPSEMWTESDTVHVTISFTFAAAE